MTHIYAEKIARIADRIPEQDILGEESGELLIVGWGSTYGAIQTAVRQAQKLGKPVSSIHIRYINPFPRNLEDILGRFEKIIVPEMNTGQLTFMLNGRFQCGAVAFPKVQGLVFKISEITDKIDEVLG